MSRVVIFVPAAAEQAAAALGWWRANRPAAPDLFAIEVGRAIDRIRVFPGAGAAVPHPTMPTLRRVLMARVRYHLYYRVDEAMDAAVVLAVWSAERGHGPPLERRDPRP